jgi:4-carboxymuconolactone decarboxylase
MAEWTNRDERRAAAQAEYARIMTTPAPDATGAYVDAGVIGFVFGEMWRRGVLTARDRRWITLTCVGACDAAIPIESHVWAALHSGDITVEEFDEFTLHFGTQLGWPKGSVLNMQGAIAAAKLAAERHEGRTPIAFEPWTDPVDDDTRRARGDVAYREVHGVEAPAVRTPFRGRAYLDFLYGEVWTRDRYLTRRDRRIISICCAAVVGVDVETREHLRAALASGDLTVGELEELVVHYAVYVGWLLGRHLDDLLVEVADASADEDTGSTSP